MIHVRNDANYRSRRYEQNRLELETPGGFSPAKETSWQQEKTKATPRAEDMSQPMPDAGRPQPVPPVLSAPGRTAMSLDTEEMGALPLFQGNASPGKGQLPPLRPYQEQALNSLRVAISQGHKRIVLRAPTGAGKTLVAAHIIDRHVTKGGRPMFCVDAISLVDQTAKVFYDAGIEDIGVIQANHEMTNGAATVQVASIQTLARRKAPDGITLVLVDECHCQFQSLYKLMDRWDKLIFIGLTATPYAKGMGKHWQHMVTVTSTAELIESGNLSPFRVFAPSHPDLSGVKTVAGDYHEGQLSEAMNKDALVGSIIEHWRNYGTPDKTLAFGVDRAHAQSIAEKFNAEGVPCGYLDAFTDLEERRVIAKKFKSGEYKVVANCGVLTKGIDWDVRTLILARPTKSPMLYQQIVGRALRTADGKEHATIIDMSSTTSKLGLLTDMELEYTELDDGKPKVSTGSDKKKEILPKECPKCTMLKPKGIHACPHCGFAPKKQSDVEYVGGNLVEFGGKKGKATKAEKRNREWDASAKALFLGELKAYAAHKNYSEGWASNQYREFLSVWPNKIQARQVPFSAISLHTLSWIRARQIRYAKGMQKK